MNSALLKTAVETKESAMLNNHMFGKFKGFTMKPLPKDTGPSLTTSNVAYVHPVTKIEDPHNVVPARPAPSPPKHFTQPAIIEHTDSKSNSLRSNFMSSVNATAVAPALPPYNVGTNPRPIISSPILEASTCSAKELNSPLNKNPVRRAPTPPVHASSRSSPAKSTVSFESEKKEHHKSNEGFGSGTLKRIQSFLKKDEDTLRHNQNLPKKLTIDREKLKNIEISAPIPQFDAESIDGEDTETIGGVNRTQSMRDPNAAAKKRTNVQSFGSMRHPSTLKRPKSFVGQRPKIPPPPRPPAPAGCYQNPPPPVPVDYDACETIEQPNLSHISEECSPTDNIYAVIDEVPTGGPTSDGSLLGEIVNEIEKKNAGSIYSASTLKRNKRNERDSIDQCYENTQNLGDDSENEYANVHGKSTGSTTSSGYLRPSAINAPIARITPTKVEPPTTAFSSFKSTDNRAAVPINRNNNIISTPSVVKSTPDGGTRPNPYSSSFSKKDEKLAGNKDKVPTSRPTFNRTITPTNLAKKTNSLRSRSPSPKQTPAAQLNKSNSTALDGSASNRNKNSNNITTKPKPLQKPITLTTNLATSIDEKTKRPKWQTTPSNPVTKTVDMSKVINGNKNENESTTTATVKKLNSNRTANAPKLSHVASIQQKFENGNPKVVVKTTAKK